MVTVTPASAYCINLERRTDRKEAMLAQWKPEWIPLQFFKAIEKPNHSAACMESHKKVLSTANDPVLVLEDDALFSPDFNPTITDVPDDWDCLWLGGYLTKPALPYDVKWRIPTGMSATHAYVVREPHAVAAMINLEHPDGLFRPMKAAGFKQYALNVWAVAQSSGYSDIMRGYQPERYWI